MAAATGSRALARFHVHVGAQLAMRAAAPLAGAPVVALLVQQDPSAAICATAAWLLGPWGGPGAGLATAALALMLATWAVPRVTAGLAGWARHLPASGTTHRRAALLAVITAQGPLFVALLLLAPIAAKQAGGLDASRVLALPLVAAAAALASWPGERAWRSRPLAWLALLLLSHPGPTSGVAALLLLALADRFAGALPSSLRLRRRRPSPLPTPLLISLRALGVGLEASALFALLPVGAMALLRLNNDLAPALAAGAARLGGGLGVVFALAAVAGRLAVRRPAWPWARSLPVGSRRRVAEDAALLAAPCAVPLAATAALDPLAALTVAACLPFLALRAAGAIRQGSRPGSGLSTFYPAEAALLAAWVAVLPWLSLAALAAAPLARNAAAERDRRQKVGRWDGLHHRAVGDPLSWSAR